MSSLLIARSKWDLKQARLGIRTAIISKITTAKNTEFTPDTTINSKFLEFNLTVHPLPILDNRELLLKSIKANPV